MAKKANVHTRNVIQCVQEKTATYTFGDKIAKSQPMKQPLQEIMLNDMLFCGLLYMQ